MAASLNVLQLTQQTGTADTSSVFYAVKAASVDTGLPLSVLVNSLGLTGTPTAPTAVGGTNTTQIASTSYVFTNYAALTGATFSGSVVLNAALTISGLTGYLFANGGSAVTASSTIPNTSITGLGTLSTQNATAVAITGGSINGTSIGPGTPASGAFTTLSATGLITPSTTNGIKGTTLADNANAGSVGEYLTGTTGLVSISTNVPFNATSVTLTAGDWDVTGVVSFVPAGSTVVSLIQSGISTTSSTLPAGNTGGYNTIPATQPTGAASTLNAPVVRINVSTSTPVYLIGTCGFITSTCQGEGFIRARRVR